MQITSLIQQLAEQDIRLWLEQEQLRFSAPEGAMTADKIAQLREHKSQIIEFLKQADSRASIAIPVADAEKPLEVSSAQQRLWFMQKLDPSSSALHIHNALELKGQLNTQLLEQACLAIIQRHAILRSSYYQESGKLYQKVHETFAWQLEKQNIQAEQLAAALAKNLHQPFDLAAAPLLRCLVLQLSPTHFVLSFCVHHIAADGWSLGIFVQELIAIYQALSQGQSITLVPLARQYADFSAWQKTQARQLQLQKQLAYWQSQLQGVPDLLLPTEKQSVYGQQAGHVSCQIDNVLLQDLSKRYGTTLFVNMMALFSCLLHRYSQQTDFCIGTPVAGRDASVLEPMIGCFINVLAIRCEPEAQLPFSDYLLKVKKTCHEALENQNLPFEQVVQSLNLSRDLNQTPLFQTMLSVQNAPFKAVQLEHLAITPLVDENAQAQFDLKLAVQQQGSQLLLDFEYKKALFDASFIERMAEHFDVLCHSVWQNTETEVGQLVYFDTLPAEQLTGKTQTIHDDLLHQYLEQFAQQTPEAIALISQGNRLSYQELNQKANQLAHYFIEQGVTKGDFIALCLRRSNDLLIALLAVLKAGAAYVPIDPALPAARIDFILQDSQAKLALSHSQCQPKNAAAWVLFDQINSADYADKNTDMAVNFSDLAYLLYTSGSTGTPKGVMIEHGALMNYLQFASREYMPKAKASMVSSSISFDATITSLFTPLLTGKSVVMSADDDGDFNQLIAKIRSDEPCLFKITPAHLSFLAHRLPVNSSQAAHVFVVGGEQFLLKQLNTWLAITPNARFINEYGPTETVVGCCILAVDKHNAKDYQNQAAVPIGLPIDNAQLQVLDANLQAVPYGIVGELYIGGAGLARSYLNLPEKSEQSFITRAGKRLYKTGDLVRLLADGNLLYCGRQDAQVKLRGQRLELGEIEAVLQNYPALEQAVVKLCDVQNDRRLVAWYSAKQALDEVALKAYLAERLPAYMLPSALILMEQWPLNSNGKISRNKLPEPDWNALNRVEFVAPRSETEKQLANIWQQVLGIENIGINDDFFSLGGHSLTAAEALALAQQHYQVELPLRKIFETPTIAAIAQLLDEALLAQKILAENTDEESESFVL